MPQPAGVARALPAQCHLVFLDGLCVQHAAIVAHALLRAALALVPTLGGAWTR
jgi:hypothetical protein